MSGSGMALSPAGFAARYESESGPLARTAEYRQTYIPRRSTNAPDDEDDHEWFDDPAAALACVGAKFIAVHRFTAATDLGANPPVAWYDMSACRLYEDEPKQCEAMGLDSLCVSDDRQDIYGRIVRANILFLETVPMELTDGDDFKLAEEIGGLTRQTVDNMQAVLTRLQTEAKACFSASQNVWAKLLAHCGLLSRHVLEDEGATMLQVALLEKLYAMGSGVFPDAVFLAYKHGVCSTRLAVHDFLLSNPGQLPLLNFHLQYLLAAATPEEVAAIYSALSLRKR